MAISDYGRVERYREQQRRWRHRQGRPRHEHIGVGTRDPGAARLLHPPSTTHRPSNRRGAGAPPSCVARLPGPFRPRPAPERAGLGRRGGSPPLGGRPGAGGAARQNPRVLAALPPSGRCPHLRGQCGAPHRPARLHPRGRHDVHAGGLRRPGAPGVGGARPPAPRSGGGAVQRHHAVRRAPPRLGPVRGRARARRRQRIGPGARRQREGDRRRIDLRTDRADGPPARAAARRLSEVLRNTDEG